MEAPENRNSETAGDPNGTSSGVVDWLSRRLNLTEIFSVLTSYGLFYAEVDTRKRLREALAEALDRPHPSYARGPRVLGLFVVILLGVEVLTGFLLSLYYLPTPESAHDSVGTILRDVDFGWLVHQVHYWAAQLLVAVLIVRLLRFFVHRVFEPPRELFWVLGATLLLVVFHADLTGRVLPWTQTAYWTAVRSLEVVKTVPIYGHLATFLVGGDQTYISDLMLIRAYIFHVAVLPALALTLIYLHFSAVRRVGLREIAGETVRTGTLFLRRHMANLAILFVIVFGLLVSLAILTPTAFKPEADPFATVPQVGPPWYLLAPFGFIELTSSFLPSWFAGLILFVGFTVFLIVPFVFRRRLRSGGPWLFWVVAAVVLILWILLSLYGLRVA